jgi:hypothetical protein
MSGESKFIRILKTPNFHKIHPISIETPEIFTKKTFSSSSPNKRRLPTTGNLRFSLHQTSAMANRPLA